MEKDASRQRRVLLWKPSFFPVTIPRDGETRPNPDSAVELAETESWFSATETVKEADPILGLWVFHL